MSPYRARRPRTGLIPVHLPGRLSASAALLLHHGAMADPVDREGTADTWAVLFRRDGTPREQETGEGLEVALEELGTTLTLEVGWRTIRIRLDSTPEHLTGAFALLSRALDVFRPEAREVRALALRRGQALAAARQAPGGSAGPLLDAALFPESRYGCRTDGSALTRVDAEAVGGFHQGVLRAPRDLVVAADLARVDLRTLVRSGSSPAPGPHPAVAEEPETAAGRVRPLTLRRGTGAGTCVVMIGVRAAVNGDAPLFLEIARRLLAGTASSRLSRALRDFSALAYAVHSEVRQDGAVCALRFRFSVASSQAPSAVATALGELFGLRARQLDADDLRGAVETYPRDGTGSPAAVAATHGTHVARPAVDPTTAQFRAAVGELVRPEGVAVVVDGALHEAAVVRQAVVAAAEQNPSIGTELRAYARRVAASQDHSERNVDASELGETGKESDAERTARRWA